MSLLLRVAGLVNDSIVDGPGLRLAVFTQGCPHHCLECHNPHTHNPVDGYHISVDKIVETVDNNPLLDGVTFTGGEPLLQVEPLSFLAKEIKKRSLHLMIYTGYTWDEISEDIGQYFSLLQYTDTLVDGRYIPSLKSLDLPYRGSSNQSILDVQCLLKNFLEFNQHTVIQTHNLPTHKLLDESSSE